MDPFNTKQQMNEYFDFNTVSTSSDNQMSPNIFGM